MERNDIIYISMREPEKPKESVSVEEELEFYRKRYKIECVKRDLAEIFIHKEGLLPKYIDYIEYQYKSRDITE